jgi:5-methylthioadenosine/S-adenosylhomocysteine deaminase
MVDLTVLHATVITLDKQRRVIEDGGIAVEGRTIVEVAESDEIISKYGEGRDSIDASGMLAIPGLINAHTHMFQDLLRGLGDDMELMGWLRHMLYPVSQALTDEDVYAGALLGCAEMIKTGTTFVVDNHHINTSEGAISNVARAIEETGIKGMIARGMKIKTKRCEKWGLPDYLFQYDFDEEVKLAEKLIKRWHGAASGRIQVCPAPVAIYSTGPELLMEAKRISDKFEVPIHTHIAESPAEVESTLEDYGKREVELLNEIGVLCPRFHVVHAIWLDDREIGMLAEKGANVVHCPVSNMIIASGVAKVPKMLKSGINVALATDGPASNHNQDMMGVLKTTALLHKVATLDPLAIRCENVLEMATLGGARALGLEHEIGSLEAGKKADITLIDLRKPHIAPVHRAISALVYCAMGSDVDTVIIDGKVVMRGRKLLTIDEEEAMSKAEGVADELVERSKIGHLKRRDWPR